MTAAMRLAQTACWLLLQWQFKAVYLIPRDKRWLITTPEVGERIWGTTACAGSWGSTLCQAKQEEPQEQQARGLTQQTSQQHGDSKLHLQKNVWNIQLLLLEEVGYIKDLGIFKPTCSLPALSGLPVYLYCS